MTMTTQKQIRAAFWRDHPDFTEQTEVQRCDRNGTIFYTVPSQNDYPTDTRCAFVDYVDALQKSGVISEALAARVTL